MGSGAFTSLWPFMEVVVYEREVEILGCDVTSRSAIPCTRS